MIAVDLHSPEHDPSREACPILDPAGEVTVDLSEIVRAEPAIDALAPLYREPAPMLIHAPATEPTPPPQPKRARTPAPSLTDRYDPSLPEARRSAPRPIDFRKELARRRPAREKTPKPVARIDLFDSVFLARAFKVFTVLTFALALLALDLRFARGLGLDAEGLGILRMLAHLGIGGGVVALLQSRQSSSKVRSIR